MHVDWSAPFWRLVHPEGLSGCWLWHGTVNRAGYGTTSARLASGRFTTRLAHRVSYEKCVGQIPPGSVLRHRCDVPACVNPCHIEPGTQADNVRDAVARLRHMHGDQHTSAKLSRNQAQAIRARHARGESGRALAREFGINQSTVSRLLCGMVWKED